MSWLLLLISQAQLIKQELTIYYNPSTSEGKAVVQQLTTDLTKLCNKWPQRERIMGFNAVVKHEFDRRRIHKYFNVKFEKTSDVLAFRVGSGNKIIFPKSNNADPREYPGYINFFSWVVDVNYTSYFNDLRKEENRRIQRRWAADRQEKYVDFIFSLVEKGYEEYWDEYPFEGFSHSLFKDGKFFTPEQLGWHEPDPPILIQPLPERLCPINSKWRLK